MSQYFHFRYFLGEAGVYPEFHCEKHLTTPSLKLESNLGTDLYRDVCTVKMLQRFSFSELYAEIFVDS